MRPGEVSDLAFVSATWKQNFWRESPWANRLTWQVFSAGHTPIVDRLLASSQLLVACDPEEPDEIFGYLVFGSGVIHFAYVKPAFRRKGLLNSLLAGSGLPKDLAGVRITHGTRAWFSAPPLTDRATGRVVKPERPGIEKKYPLALHDPYT